MRPDSETGTIDRTETRFWLDSIATTDPEKIRPMAVPLKAPWTEVHYRELDEEVYLDTFSLIYHWDAVRPLFRFLPTVPTTPTPTFEGLPQEPVSDLSRYVYCVPSYGTQKHHEWHYEWLENFTTKEQRSQDIDEKIEALFEAAKEQFFEDGMESDFSREFVSFIKKYGDAAMEAVASVIISEKGNAEIASEALRWMGLMDHPPSYRYRLWVLERSLICSSERVRDSAALGLAYFNDPDAIQHLKKAIEREQIPELREDMKQVLTQLETAQ